MNRLDQIKVHPYANSFGAEITGVNFASLVSEEIRTYLEELWHTYLVLVFRKQNLTQKQHLAAARLFGDLHVSAAKAYHKKAGIEEVLTAQFPEISIVHNLDKEGNPVAENRGLGSGIVPWHSDNSYVECPPAGSLLYGIAVSPTGGETCFADQYRAFVTLPDDIKESIMGRTAVHDASRDGADMVRPGLEIPKSLSDVPGPHHPLVRRHPATGKLALFLGRRRKYPSQYIDDFTPEESEEMLNYLWKHAIKPEFVFCHKWEPGDLVMWDNRCTMHSRKPFPVEYKRIMHRVMIKGDHPQ